MNIVYISKRLEIAFWAMVVSLLQDRKALHIIAASLSLSLLVWVVTLVVAFGNRSAIGPWGAGLVKPAGALRADEYQRPSNGQQNILILLADQVQDASPKLRGAWLVIYSLSEQRLIWLPIYPTMLNGAAQEERLAAAFQLDGDGAPAPGFVQNIQPSDLWWDHYVVLDQVAIAELIDRMGGVYLEEDFFEGTQSMEALPLARQSPQATLTGQALLLQAMCDRTAILLSASEPQDFFERLSDHMRTDFSAAYLAARLGHLRDLGEGLACEFPTLQGLLPTALQSR